MANPRQDERPANSAGQDATRRTTEEATRTARTVADIGEHAARASADSIQRNAEAAQQTWQSASDMAARLTERSADQLARAFGLSGEEAQQAAHQSSRNFGAIMQSSVVLSHGMQNISREWFDFARKRMAENLNLLEALTRCRTPQDIAAVQSNVMRDNLEDLLQSTKRIADMSVRIADEAARKVAEGADRDRRAA
ncbi:MAG: phasin family protein [Xanthobacteraceae bacterium]